MIIPVHSLDPIPNCQTARVETIIAQFLVLCTGNFVFFAPQDESDAARGGGSGEI
jgi:hypothetical protein